MKQQANTNVARMIVSRSDIYLQWLKITRELHELTDSEMQLAAAFLERYIEFKDKILDEELLNEFLMSTKVKNSIRERAGITEQTTFQNRVTALRKKGFLDENDIISKAFIPKLNSKSKFFNIVFTIKIKENDDTENQGRISEEVASTASD